MIVKPHPTYKETIMTEAARVRLPLLPLRDIVVFPKMTMPLLIGREKSRRACEAALAADGVILLVAQQDASVENPAAGDLYRTGIIATIEQHLAEAGSTLKLLVRGGSRAKITDVSEARDGLTALAEPIDDAGDDEPPFVSFKPEFALQHWPAKTSPVADGRADFVATLQRLLENDDMPAAESA